MLQPLAQPPLPQEEEPGEAVLGLAAENHPAAGEEVGATSCLDPRSP